MPDIIEAVDAKNVQSRRDAEAVRLDAQKKSDQARAKKRTDALVKFALREVAMLAVLAATWLSLDARLIAWQIAFAATTFVMFCMGYWCGTWVQFLSGGGEPV